MIRGNIIQGFLVCLLSLLFATDKGMSLTKDCLDPPIPYNYTPRGIEYEIGNLTVYDSNNQNSTRLLVAVYDIIGFSKELKEIVDSVAEKFNFRVVLPDMLRGNWWEGVPIPPDPEHPEELWIWLERNASWAKVVKWDLLNVMNTFRARNNFTEAGIFGMCWGGYVTTLAVTELSDLFKAGAIVHPSYVDSSNATGVQSPMYLMPASNDSDLLPFYEVLKERFGNNSGHRRFDDMRHGFAGARGNWSDPVIRDRVDEVISILGEFFSYNFPI